MDLHHYLASDGISSLEPGFFLQAAIFLVVVLATVGSGAGIILVILTIVDRMKGRRNTEINVNPSPVPIRQVYEHPTREEFTELKIEVKAIEKKLPDMELRIVKEIQQMRSEIADSVERVGEKAYNGRKELHKKHGELAAEVVALKARSEKK